MIRLVIWQIFTGRIELFQQAPIGGVKDAIFCPCSVLVVMFAEELELVQSAKTKGLSKQEKQPIYFSLFLRYNWLHAIILMAQCAIEQSWDHPVLWCAVVH